MKIGKNEIIEKTYCKLNGKISKKETTDAVKAVFDAITDSLIAGNNITIVGFGSWKIQNVKEKKGNNIHTGEPITIPAHNRVKFEAGKTIKEAINK